MNINLHIERLVLDGLPIARSQGVLVQRAVETELARLLAADGLSPGLLGGGVLPHVPAIDIQLTSGNDSTVIGRQIAQSVHGGIGK
jgi:hypothetical protein